jgi:hypothetical protein
MAAHADIERRGKRDLHVKAWLYTIARNRCLSLLRARREQPTDEVVEVSTDRLLSDVEQREDIRALLADFAKLPTEQREALVLSEIGDLSHADIGEVLGCEVSKVKSLVFQARSALIDRRSARETPCEEIREQLATLRGGALRRSQIRHHLEACPGCSEYREEIRRQRAMLAVALPVVPSAALRADVLGSVGLGGSSAAAGAGAAGAGAGASGATGIAGAVAQGGLAKLGVAVAIAATGAGGAAVAHNGGLPLVHKSSATEQFAPGERAGNNPAHTGAAFSGTGAAKSSQAAAAGSNRSASGTTHGFTPTKGASNGAAARQFAASRGKGKHTGTVNKHHKRAVPSHTKPANADRVRHVAAPQRGRNNTPLKAHTRTAPTRTGSAPVARGKTTPTATTTTPTTTNPAPEATVPPPTSTTTTPVPTVVDKPATGTKKTANSAG